MQCPGIKTILAEVDMLGYRRLSSKSAYVPFLALSDLYSDLESAFSALYVSAEISARFQWESNFSMAHRPLQIYNQTFSW